MQQPYDLVIITHVPCFYKVNLYHQLAKQLRLYVIFVAPNAQNRTADFVELTLNFAHCFLSTVPLEKRRRFITSWAALRKLKKLTYHQVLLSGWELPEFWAIAWLTQTPKLLALESNCFESTAQGIKAWVKQRFLSQIAQVLASGTPHQQLLTQLGYQKPVWLTQGVGIFYRAKREVQAKINQGRFLYVGRLAPEKNLSWLLAIFAQLPQYQLTLIGQGPLKASLKALAPPNVVFQDHVPNAQLGEHYLAHDIFILPSLREPWGLVVEEALYYGLPVLASHTVGCAQDLLVKHQVGYIFSPQQKTALITLLQAVMQPEIYQRLQQNVQQLDFQQRDQWQIHQYIKACQ